MCICLKNYKVVLFDSEEPFVHGLMHAVNGDATNPIEIAGFTDLSLAKKCLEEQGADLWVTSEGEEGPAFPAEKTLWMVAREESFVGDDLSSREEAREHRIFKYSCVSDYIAAMLSLLGAEGPKKVFSGDEGLRFLAVYTPWGGYAPIAYAGALCEEQGRMSEGKTLYISMGEFACAGDAQGMEELLYDLKERPGKVAKDLAKYKTAGEGYDLLPGVGSYVDLRELQREDLENLRRCLREDTPYHTVVVAVGAASLPDFELFTVFDRIYIPTPKDPRERRIYERFLLELQRRNLWQALREKCCEVRTHD